MAESHLPDDLDDWPEDPFDILGVTKDVEQRTAHRAYIRLIKKFKPDHSPEKFQRIHEAFECVKNAIVMREQFGPWDEDDEDELADDSIEWDSSDGFAPNPFYSEIELDDDSVEQFSLDELSSEDFSMDDEESQILAQETLDQLSRLGLGFTFDEDDDSTRFAEDDEAEEIWREAVAGEYETAYAKLRSLAEKGDRGTQIWMRLYWLLKVVPEIDESKEPVDWLIQGMHETDMSASILGLYVREIRLDPEEGIKRRCTKLLDCNGSFNAKAELLQYRWDAASRLDNWGTIVEDLERVGKHRGLEDDENWARVLLSAVDHLAWFELQAPLSILSECLDELEEMVHVHQLLDDELHRADVLIQVAAGTHALGRNQWTELVRKSWVFQIGEMLPEVEATLAPLAEDPIGMLSEIDDLVARSPVAMSQLAEFVERAQFLVANEYEEDNRDEEEIMRLLRPFFGRFRDYQQSRVAILTYCISESLDPATIIQAADARISFTDSWTDQFECDVGLRLVYAAYRAFEA